MSSSTFSASTSNIPTFTFITTTGLFTDTPVVASSSSGLSLPTAEIVSISAALGVAVVAIPALSFWMWQRRRSRHQRVSLASERTWPARQTRREASHTAETVATSIQTRMGSISDNSEYTVVGHGETLGAKEGRQGDPAAGGASRPTSAVESGEYEGRGEDEEMGEDEDGDQGSTRVPSLRERLREFFAGARSERGSVSSSEGPPPAYEPHVLPEYDASP